MSDNPAPNAFVPPPPGLNYIEAIRPSLNLLMIGSVWGSLLVPLLITLVFFSTRETRRKPMFILNFLAIVLGIALSILNGVLEVQALLEPLKPQSYAAFVTFGVGIGAIPILVESMLLLRVYVVYPPTQMPLLQACAIFIPLFLMKLARVTNLIVFSVHYAEVSRNVPNPVEAGQVAWRHPGEKIEWFLQVFDNTIVSCLFLYRLQGGMKLSRAARGTKSTYRNFSEKLKAIFWISTSNFVFPVILSLCQLILVFRDPDFLKASYILICNAYFAIIGVLLATVWRAKSEWVESNGGGAQSYLPSMHFGCAQSSKANSEVAVVKHTLATDDDIPLHEFNTEDTKVYDIAPVSTVQQAA